MTSQLIFELEIIFTSIPHGLIGPFFKPYSTQSDIESGKWMEVRQREYNITGVGSVFNSTNSLFFYIPFIKSIGNKNAIANTGESLRPSDIFGAWKSDVWIRRYKAFESVRSYVNLSR